MHSIKFKEDYLTRNKGTFRAKYYSFLNWLDDQWYKYAPESLRFLRYRLRDFWYDEISTRLNPRQKWLTSKILRTWQDKPTIIENVLYECIIHFVEGEKCLEVTDWAGSFEGGAQFETDLKAAYSWAKTGRAEFQKRIDAAYPLVDHSYLFDDKYKNEDGSITIPNIEERTGKTFEELYGPLHKLEEEFKQIDDKWLGWIITHREYLWI